MAYTNTRKQRDAEAEALPRALQELYVSKLFGQFTLKWALEKCTGFDKVAFNKALEQHMGEHGIDLRPPEEPSRIIDPQTGAPAQH